ncbi:MAG: aldose 1-epimerase family protein [Clostridiales bacterium]|nr:aldose 1-epimerase family protein [Clostridiales bacterium]
MSIVTIQNEFLTVSVSSLGAELQSIRDKNGVERLWQGDPQFWASRAPILFPVAGGFREDCYVMGDKRYPMPKHGFVRKLEWQVEAAHDTSVTFLMTARHEGFPFDYALRATFALAGSALSVDYAVENRGAETFWYSVGSHEAFATPEGLEAYEIVFDEEERLEDFPLQGNLIARQPVVMAEKTRTLPLKTEYFAVDALVFRTLKSRGVTLRSQAHGREIRVDYPQHGTLMLWTKPGAGYLCIEPWCNAPDFVDADLRIDHKPGFIRLDAGASATRRHTITVR